MHFCGKRLIFCKWPEYEPVRCVCNVISSDMYHIVFNCGSKYNPSEHNLQSVKNRGWKVITMLFGSRMIFCPECDSKNLEEIKKNPDLARTYWFYCYK